MISTETRKAGPFTGNGVTTVFPFTFKVFSTTELKVTSTLISTSADTVVATSAYVVALNADQETTPGGTVTAVVAPSATVRWTLTSQIAALQKVDIPNAGGFFPEVVENALDKLTALYQQSLEMLSRALLGPIGGALVTLPPPTAGTLLGWDGAGTTLVNYAQAGGGSVVANASQLAFDPSGTGFVSTTGQAKLRQYKSVIDKGADNTGATGVSAIFQKCNDEQGTFWVPDGTYLFDADVILGDKIEFIFSKNSILIPSANGRTFFKSTLHAYYSKLINPRFNGNGKTNVTGMDLTNCRLDSVIHLPYFENMQAGIILRDGCFGLTIEKPTAYNGVPNPIQVLANASSALINQPNFDNKTGTGAGTGSGIIISSGASTNLGVIVCGGYIQGFVNGVLDSGIGTKISDTYFEANSAADVSFVAARNSEVKSTQHFGATGTVAIIAKNSDALTVWEPTMASGGRTGMLDFDTSNTNCVYYNAGSNASYDTPLGVTTGLTRLVPQAVGAFTPAVVGSATAGAAGGVTIGLQKYIQTGNLVEFHAQITWTSHTGTGNIVLTGLPLFTGVATATKFNILCQFATTGPQLSAQFNGTSSNITLLQATAAGALSFIPLPAAGTLDVWGSYETT